MRLEPGWVVNNTYTVGRLVGSGSFGEVYIASHRFLGVQALKTISLDPLNIDQVFAEARALVDLNHANIVRTYDANVSDEFGDRLAFITMEYAEKGSLADVLATKVRFSEAEVAGAGTQLASALSLAHSRNPPLLHRDVKPSNVLVFPSTGPLHLKLSDFGLAKPLDAESRLTTSAGTVAYAPPEMAWGVADERSDVYSLGVTLYRCLTGIHPFPIQTPQEMTENRGRIQTLSQGRKSIAPPSRLLMRPSALGDVVMTCLEHDMFRRFKNGTEVLAALSLLLH
jgi:serine/threonine protein kinase